MKKFFSIVVLSLLAFAAGAQNWQKQSFLNDRIFSITYSNLISGLTNTQTPLNGAVPGTNNLGRLVDGLYVGGTNQPQNVITPVADGNNPGGPQVAGAPFAVSGTNLWSTNYNLFKDVTLWVDRMGQQAPLSWTSSTNVGADTGARFSPSFQQIIITVSATNTTAVTTLLRFAPVWDGINVDTNAAVIWPVGFSFTPNSANQVRVISTNFPAQNYPGCKALRLIDVTSTATTANAVGVLRNVDLIGWVP